MAKLNTTLKKYKRVWTALKKPSKQEFEMTAKVSAIGILILGLFGFIVALIVEAIAM